MKDAAETPGFVVYLLQRVSWALRVTAGLKQPNQCGKRPGDVASSYESSAVDVGSQPWTNGVLAVALVGWCNAFSAAAGVRLRDDVKIQFRLGRDGQVVARR